MTAFPSPRRTDYGFGNPYMCFATFIPFPDPPMAIRDAVEQATTSPRLRISFSRYTYESIAAGEAAESGWLDEQGIVFEPDVLDIQDGLTAVDLAARYLADRLVEPSVSQGWVPGMWYTQHRAEEDFTTGEYVDYHYHPAGFTDEEQALLAEQVRRLIQQRLQPARSALRMA